MNANYKDVIYYVMHHALCNALILSNWPYTNSLITLYVIDIITRNNRENVTLR